MPIIVSISFVNVTTLLLLLLIVILLSFGEIGRDDYFGLSLSSFAIFVNRLYVLRLAAANPLDQEHILP